MLRHHACNSCNAAFNCVVAVCVVTPIQYTVVSSAYIHSYPELKEDGRSFVISVKRVGLSTDPRGMPIDTGGRFDSVGPFIAVNCCLPFR